jgi:hypothetical protein
VVRELAALVAPLDWLGLSLRLTLNDVATAARYCSERLSGHGQQEHSLAGSGRCCFEVPYGHCVKVISVVHVEKRESSENGWEYWGPAAEPNWGW